MKKKRKIMKAWACVGEYGIYMPGGVLAIFPKKRDCFELGAKKYEIYRVEIRIKEKKK